MGRVKKARASRFAKQKNAEAELLAYSAQDGDDLMEDEIDKFHKNREKVPLESSDEEEFDNPVFDLKTRNGSDDSEDEMDDEELEGLAKAVKQRAGLLDEDDEEGEPQRDEEETNWGKQKNIYYNADNRDFELQSSDDEGPALEEAEARRLQQKMAASLQPEDFGQEEAEEEEDDEGKEQEPMPLVFQTVPSSKEDLEQNAPELVGLLSELRGALDEIEHEKVGSGEVAAKEDAYVQLKHMLLFGYCQSIVFYLTLKAEGLSVRDHPVIARLVQYRLLRERIGNLKRKGAGNEVDAPSKRQKKHQQRNAAAQVADKPEDKVENARMKEEEERLSGENESDSAPATEEAPQEKRPITYEMDKNRGLTKYRKKDVKNPRKKYKTKHGKAVIRRKGQVRDIRKQTGPYEGEATGIKTDISRSVRFK